MNDQFINYEAESAQLSDKLSAARDQIEALEESSRQNKVREGEGKRERAEREAGRERERETTYSRHLD